MKKTLQTILHTYSFDVSKEKEKQEYKDFCKKLKLQGLVMFDTLSMNSKEERDFDEKIEALNGETVELETEYLFNNQWNSSENTGSLRLMDWQQKIYQNRNYKRGYYLEVTGEMNQARLDQKKCGYCGKRYNHSSLEYCTACLGSQYLDEKTLPLLQLFPVCNDDNNRWSTTVPDWLRENWIIAQKEAGRKRIDEKIQREKNDILGLFPFDYEIK